MAKVRLVEADDWVVVFVDDEVIDSGHSIDVYYLLEKLGISHERYELWDDEAIMRVSEVDRWEDVDEEEMENVSGWSAEE